MKHYNVFTDGACIGNPGKMGIGIVIFEGDISIETYSEALGRGTNNEAEYLAVIKALELLQKYNPDKIIIHSDSQLVVYQITGEYKINHRHLHILYDKVNFLCEQLKCHIEFKWISRDKNAFADALASEVIGNPQAVIENNAVVEWKIDTFFVPDNEQIMTLPKIHIDCQNKITSLNNSVNKLKFKDFINLKTNGIDAYSRCNLDKLKKIIEIRFGKQTIEWLKQVLIKSEPLYQCMVFRWVARGLFPSLALKKISVDQEIMANGNKTKSRCRKNRI